MASTPPPPPSPTELWADIDGASDIYHLTEASFDTFIQEHKSVLVMFYAPCKFLLLLVLPYYSHIFISF